MRALVIGTPKFQIPPDQLPSVVEGAIAWADRYQDKLEVFGGFPGGGGFGIANVKDEEELNQLIIDMPFSWFSEVQVRPFVEGNTSLQQLKRAVDQIAALV